MNVLRRSDRVDIFFFEEDAKKDSLVLREELSELASMLSNLNVQIKFSELHSLSPEKLALLLSFLASIEGNVHATMAVSSTLENTLVEIGLGKIPQKLERLT